MNRNNERVTISIKNIDELKALNINGDKTNSRLEKRLELGLPINISLSKNRVLQRMINLRETIRGMQSKEAEREAGKSAH